MRHQVCVGNVLPQQIDELGRWLADGSTFDTAGADPLMIEVAPQAGLNAVLLTAAPAALTARCLLLAGLGPDGRRTPHETLTQLSRGRLRPWDDTGAPRTRRCLTC